MTLRVVALAIALILFALLLFMSLLGGGYWGGVVLLAILSAALAFERRRYGHAISTSPGEGWVETGEQFVDDASGELVRVWFNPQTGERRYISL